MANNPNPAGGTKAAPVLYLRQDATTEAALRILGGQPTVAARLAIVAAASGTGAAAAQAAGSMKRLRCCGRWCYWRLPFGPWQCTRCDRTFVAAMPVSALARLIEAVPPLTADQRSWAEEIMTSTEPLGIVARRLISAPEGAKVQARTRTTTPPKGGI